MIKKFQEYFKESISFPTSEDQVVKLCKKYRIKNYYINPDLSIDVDGDVHLDNLPLSSLPLRFSIVSGYFYCQYDRLTTLDGSPREVGIGFNCSHNRLTTLEGGPREVGWYFSCSSNLLTTLEGSPREVGEDFECSGNQLTTLDGCTIEVGGYFNCYDNPVIEILRKFPDDKKVLKFWSDFNVVRNGNEISAYRFKELYIDATGKEFEGNMKFKGYKVVE